LRLRLTRRLALFVQLPAKCLEVAGSGLCDCGLFGLLNLVELLVALQRAPPEVDVGRLALLPAAEVFLEAHDGERLAFLALPDGERLALLASHDGERLAFLFPQAHDGERLALLPSAEVFSDSPVRLCQQLLTRICDLLGAFRISRGRGAQLRPELLNQRLGLRLRLTRRLALFVQLPAKFLARLAALARLPARLLGLGLHHIVVGPQDTQHTAFRLVALPQLFELTVLFSNLLLAPLEVRLAPAEVLSAPEQGVRLADLPAELLPQFIYLLLVQRHVLLAPDEVFLALPQVLLALCQGLLLLEAQQDLRVAFHAFRVRRRRLQACWDQRHSNRAAG